jgi:hypothetical protein
MVNIYNEKIQREVPSPGEHLERALFDSAWHRASIRSTKAFGRCNRQLI